MTSPSALALVEYLACGDGAERHPATWIKLESSDRIKLFLSIYLDM
jgi:hypothetical protein